VAGNRKPLTLEEKTMDTPRTVELVESERELDAILQADFTSPTRLKMELQYFSKHNPAFRFFREVQPRLAQWWEEFSQELDQKTGGPKYKTIYQFARAKSTVPKEQDWIAQMIGPEPATYNQRNGKAPGRWLRIPWLGDWKARRMNGYWAPEHPAKIKALAKSLKEKLVGLEAVRSAGPYLVQMMARYMKLAEQVDQVFGGQPLDMNDGPSEKNKARFYSYLEMQKAVTRMQLRLFHEWMLVHGVSTDGNPVQITKVNQMLMTDQSAAGLADSMTHRDLETVKLARMLQMHAENFEMPLPETSGPVVRKDTDKLPAKGTGKVM
jgi:hypothetical protein